MQVYRILVSPAVTRPRLASCLKELQRQVKNEHKAYTELLPSFLDSKLEDSRQCLMLKQELENSKDELETENALLLSYSSPYYLKELRKFQTISFYISSAYSRQCKINTGNLHQFSVSTRYGYKYKTLML